MKQFLTLTALSLIMSISYAQDSTSLTNISDNLGNTVSSRAIYKGTILTSVNAGYSKLNGEESAGIPFNISFSTLPTLNIGYGITKFLDVRISTGWYKRSWENRIDTGSVNGLGGFGISTKVNVLKQKSWIPEVAFGVGVSFPSKKFSGSTNINSTLAWSYRFGDKFRLGGNFMMNTFYSDFSSNQEFNWQYSLNVRYEFIEGFGAYADLYSGSFSFGYFQLSGGLYYRLNPNMQLNVSGGYGGINSGSNITSTSINGGFSWLLFNK